MTVGQDSARDERRIFELFSNLERQVDALNDLIDNPVRDEDGASNESEMLGGAESRNSPETFDRWFEAMLSTASLSSTV